MKLTDQEKQEILQRRQSQRVPFGGARHEYHFAPVHQVRLVEGRKQAQEKAREGRKVYTSPQPSQPATRRSYKPPEKSNGKGELSQKANQAINKGAIYEGSTAFPVRSYDYYRNYVQQRSKSPEKSREMALEK